MGDHSTSDPMRVKKTSKAASYRDQLTGRAADIYKLVAKFQETLNTAFQNAQEQTAYLYHLNKDWMKLNERLLPQLEDNDLTLAGFIDLNKQMYDHMQDSVMRHHDKPGGTQNLIAAYPTVQDAMEHIFEIRFIKNAPTPLFDLFKRKHAQEVVDLEPSEELLQAHGRVWAKKHH